MIDGTVIALVEIWMYLKPPCVHLMSYNKLEICGPYSEWCGIKNWILIINAICRDEQLFKSAECVQKFFKF